MSLHPDVGGIAQTHVFQLTSEIPDLRRCTDRPYSFVPWANRGWKNRLDNWSQPLLTRFGVMPTLHRQDRPATLLDLHIWDQFELRRQLLRSRSVDEYCQRVFTFLWDRLRPRRCLLEKTPAHIRYVDRIKQIFPGSTLVTIYRDGRDVVVSDRFFSLDYRREDNWSFEESVMDWRRDVGGAGAGGGPVRSDQLVLRVLAGGSAPGARQVTDGPASLHQHRGARGPRASVIVHRSSSARDATEERKTDAASTERASLATGETTSAISRSSCSSNSRVRC
jgi:hypothetical protein